MARAKDWTWDNIYKEIPREKGNGTLFMNNDMVDNTGEDWVVERDRKTYHFIEAKTLVDFVFMNHPESEVKHE